MERVQIINEISTFLERSRQDLYQILDKIGWDKEGLEKDAKKCACPVDSSHVMPSSSLPEHVEKCRLQKEFVDPKEVCPSSHFYYKNSLAVVPVLIDKKKYESFKCTKNKEQHREAASTKDVNKPWECIPSDLDDIVEGASRSPNLTFDSKQPNTQDIRLNDESVVISSAKGKLPNNVKESLQDVQTSSDLQLPMSRVQFDLTSGQRLAVYDYVVQTAKAIKRRAAEEELEELQHIAENTGDEKNEEMPKSYLDTLAEMRDYKRRRQSYRAKNVHMTKRSNIEVMRDLIETQMKMLEELNQEEHDLNKSSIIKRTRSDRDDDKDTSRMENSREYNRPRERRKEERHSRDRDRDKR